MIPETKLRRRCIGSHDMRLFGIEQILSFAPGASVLDIGCNRGQVLDDFVRNGASVVHGCDRYEEGVEVARAWFTGYPNLQFRFETVDLAGGGEAMRQAFGEEYYNRYDIVVMLATYHKLKRQLAPEPLDKLMLHFGKRTQKYFAWRGYADEVAELDAAMERVELRRVHYSEIAKSMEPAAIWERK